MSKNPVILSFPVQRHLAIVLYVNERVLVRDPSQAGGSLPTFRRGHAQLDAAKNNRLPDCMASCTKIWCSCFSHQIGTKCPPLVPVLSRSEQCSIVVCCSIAYRVAVVLHFIWRCIVCTLCGVAMGTIESAGSV
jgi:hypothetical protein